mgnify:CR=1 FL=1
MGVTHHCVQKDLREWQLSGQGHAHHHHPCNPEEQDIMACLQQGSGIEGL